MQSIEGIPASGGIAIGPAYIYHPQTFVIPRHNQADFAQEWARLETALAQAKQELLTLRQKVTQESGEEEAQIFDAHIMMLADPTLLTAVRNLLEQQKLNAEAALDEAMNLQITKLEALDDPYLAARSADLRDVSQRIIRILLGLNGPSLSDLNTPVILIAHDLTPSDTAALNKNYILGFCTAIGGPTAHTAILARSLGLAAVVGAGEQVMDIPPGTLLILDGDKGQVIISPDENALACYRQQQRDMLAQQAVAKEAAQAPAFTSDGKQVKVMANIGSVEDIETVLTFGAEGVGLLRTEFLYLERTAPPDEEEQFQAYHRLVKALEQRPLIIRTLDIGGDKNLPYLSRQPEENPFLGHRGLRLCLAEPEMFKTQLRAILRAANAHNVKVMFPMVTTVEEVRQAKQLLRKAQTELESKNIPCGQPDVGIMIEVPTAAVTADLLAREVDFFSIGTNDLTQYAMAADRTNSLVQPLADALHPGVLRLIATTIQRAHEAGIWVGLCGELAGDPVAVPILLGLDLDEFSMAATSIPAVKAAIRTWSIEEAKIIARTALQQEDAATVRKLLRLAS